MSLTQRMRHTEYLLASIALWWGVWLISPFWESFPTTPAFRVMAAIAPEWAWGVVMLSIGGLLIVGLRRVDYPLRRVALLIMALLWMAIWVALLMGNWRGPGTILYIHLSVLCVIAYLRLSHVEQ